MKAFDIVPHTPECKISPSTECDCDFAARLRVALEGPPDYFQHNAQQQRPVAATGECSCGYCNYLRNR